MAKNVDWSTFTSGFNIPVEMQPALYALIGRQLKRGEKMAIKVLLDGEIFDASLSNSGFNADKFASHKTDIVRVMYGNNSRLARQFQKVFADLFLALTEIKKTLAPKKQIKIPEELKASFSFSLTATTGLFEIEPIKAVDISPALVSEDVFESDDLTWIDRTASIEQRQRLIKVRKVDRGIGDNLKRLYDYRCQVTDEKVGDEYGKEVVEAHHIDYFVSSQNNDSSNIVILSPNFHRIIHANNPIFNFKQLRFEFANGATAPLRRNLHLKAT